MTYTAADYARFAQQARTAQGKISIAALIDMFIGRGHGEFEAAAHVAAMGCNADRAYAVAYERITAR
jgi:hypothetical protein